MHLLNRKTYIRDMTKGDWKAVHAYASLEKVCIYQPWGPNTERESQAFVNQVLKDADSEKRRRFVFALVLKENDQMIGSCEINIRDVPNREGEIAYIIHPDYWGQGFATEASQHLLSFAFSGLELHRIFATCDPRNIASARVLEKAGMVFEGRIRENLLIRDGWRDSLQYSILQYEWSEK